MKIAATCRIIVQADLLHFKKRGLPVLIRIGLFALHYNPVVIFITAIRCSPSGNDHIPLQLLALH
jgi:hypothetical protein